MSTAHLGIRCWPCLKKIYSCSLLLRMAEGKRVLGTGAEWWWTSEQIEREEVRRGTQENRQSESISDGDQRDHFISYIVCPAHNSRRAEYSQYTHQDCYDQCTKDLYIESVWVISGGGGWGGGVGMCEILGVSPSQLTHGIPWKP